RQHGRRFGLWVAIRGPGGYISLQTILREPPVIATGAARGQAMTTDFRSWVDGLTIPQAFERTAARFPERDALVFPQLGYRRTYHEMAAEVREVARALLALGVRPGEHVGIWASNRPEWVLLQFATAHLGAVLVNIN